jgi:hypothetical protein
MGLKPNKERIIWPRQFWEGGEMKKGKKPSKLALVSPE